MELSESATKTSGDARSNCTGPLARARVAAHWQFARWLRLDLVRFRRAAFEALLLLLVTLIGAEARGDSEPLDLEFRAPPECGPGQQVQDAVRTMVHRDRPRLKAALEVEQVGDVYVASVGTGSARRRLSASSCRAVLEAASVVLALAIDPSRSPQPQVLARSAPREPAPAATRPFQALLSAAVLADSSTLPSLALGGKLSAGLAWPRWSASLDFSGWYPQDAWVNASPERGGHFTWWAAGLSVCAAPFTPTWASLCLAPEIGRLAGRGIGESLPRRVTASATWLAIGFGPQISWQFERHWALRAGILAEATLLGRHSFVLELSDSTVSVHRPGRISARGQLGLAAFF